MLVKAKRFFDESGRGMQIAMLVLYDILAIMVSVYGALYIRYDFSIVSIDGLHLGNATRYLPFQIITTIIVFTLLRLYQSLWRYASVREMLMTTVGCVSSAVLQWIITWWVFRYRMPRSYYVLYLFLFLVMSLIGRFSYRLVRFVSHFAYLRRHSDVVNTMIIGAGNAGAMLIREMRTSYQLRYQAVCIIDDNQNKHGSRMYGVPIVGGRDKIATAVNQYGVQEILIAIPTLTALERKELVDICKETGCKCRILPGIYQMVRSEVHMSDFREVQIEDLLGREPIHTNMDEVMDYVENRVVLVTGGGGSIGSELCRQIASHNPKQLIIFDIYENTTYDIQLELQKKYPELNLVVLIGSVRNTLRLDRLFETYRPELVYHAAAHKHVPLMEESPNEAVKNNVLGTWKIVQAADKWKVKRFVMISTDKAVNPTNIMGATKRICEMIIQTYDKRSETEFVAVRFGNVLGSNGSVIPIFRKQIAAGGPVTVTHPDIVRYFMTISEAVALVLQAGAYAKGGEIFVLDMGEPVKIDTLARNLIKLSGYQPDVEIPVVYTGLRPGEKLFEEMLMAEEGLQETENKLIHIGKPIEMDDEKFLEQLQMLRDYVEREPYDIRNIVSEIVKTYHPNSNGVKEDDKKTLSSEIKEKIEQGKLVEVV